MIGREIMQSLDTLFERLRHSPFRSRFHLGIKELVYLQQKGFGVVMQHASRFVDERLVPVEPKNDGRQTPMRGHPVFIAQHATATCCRGCLQKWHDIAAHHALDHEEKAHVLAVIGHWICLHGGASVQANLLSDESSTENAHAAAG